MTMVAPPRAADAADPWLERLARVAVITSALAAIALETWLGRLNAPPLALMAIAGGLTTAALARHREAWGFAAPLAVAFVVPVIFLIFAGRFEVPFHVVWFAGMLGAVIGAPGSVTRWSWPPAWRVPLAMWALIVAVAWPIVVAREADFTLAWLTRVHHMANSGLGGPPPVVSIWVINVALTVLTGLLWFDRLFAYASRPETFRRWVVYPMSVGAFLGCALAAYQGLVDVHFLNGSHWPSINRAGGGVVDGDAFGSAAGIWATAFLAVAAGGGIAAGAFGALGVLTAWAGAWATGSRMALAAALVGAVMTIPSAVRSAIAARQRFKLAIGVLAVAGAAALLAFGQWGTQSPLQRAREALPELNRASLARFVEFELFNRGAPYGTASVMMFQESPLVGAGIGSFNEMLPDYSYRIERVRRGFDNAQSWYRQQFAEMGLIGSAGWVIWLISLCGLLLRTRGRGDSTFAAGAIKAALLALGLVTTVSLPTQSTFVSLLPWVLVFWYLILAPEARARLDQQRPSSRTLTWAGVWACTVVFAGLTIWEGWTQFRPPLRAVRAKWSYAAGLDDLEQRAGEPSFRWLEKRAVVVFPMTEEWLKLTVRGGPPDIGSHPVALIVRRQDRKKIVNVTRTSPAAETWYLQRPANSRWMMLEFEVSRDHAVAVDDWAFVVAPPRGATVIR